MRSVWVAETNDVLVLATEADTLKDLRTKILAIKPDLIELNSSFNGALEIQVHIIAEHLDRVRNPAFS